MSLIISIVIFVSVGLIFLFITRNYHHGSIDEKDYEYNHIYKQHRREEKISLIALAFLLIYMFGLALVILWCFGAGILSWFKTGNWLTISPDSIISTLPNNSFIKSILLKESSWVGVQEINTWFLQSNVAWLFLFTLVSIMLISAFTNENT